MKFKNCSDRSVDLRMLGLGSVEPYGEIEIPDEHTAPGRTAGGQRAKSTIEQTAPQMQPSDPDERAKWLAMPAPPLRPSTQEAASDSRKRYLAGLANTRCSG